jgi:hypothetical protein
VRGPAGGNHDRAADRGEAVPDGAVTGRPHVLEVVRGSN